MSRVYFVTILFVLAALGVAGCADDEETTVTGSSTPTPPPITNVVLAPTSPDTLLGNRNVNMTFDYTGMPAGGGKIFAIPYPIPGSSWSSTTSYPSGSGSGTAWISKSYQSLPGQVDSVVVTMEDTSRTLLYDTTLYVDYFWTDQTMTFVSNIVLSPPSPDTLQGNEKLNITFDYTGMPAGGGNIWVFPFPPTAWSGSPVYPEGDGSGTAFAFVDSLSLPGRVDSLVFVVDDTSGATMYDTTVFVDYVWQ